MVVVSAFVFDRGLGFGSWRWTGYWSWSSVLDHGLAGLGFLVLALLGLGGFRFLGLVLGVFFELESWSWSSVVDHGLAGLGFMVLALLGLGGFRFLGLVLGVFF